MRCWVVSVIILLGLFMIVGGTLTHAYRVLSVDTGQFPDRWDDIYTAFYPYRQYTASLLFGGIFLLSTGLALFYRSRNQREILLSKRTRVTMPVSIMLTLLLIMWLGTFVGFDPGPIQTRESVDVAIWNYFLTNMTPLPLLFITGLAVALGLANWMVRRTDRNGKN